MLRTKCIKSPSSSEDGLRISVMSRHTLCDGVTPDVEIAEEMYDDWWPVLAPPPSLLGQYYKRGLAWVHFEQEYKKYLGLVEEQICRLVSLALKGDVTILCVEAEPKQCHRRLIAERCGEMEPRLQVVIF